MQNNKLREELGSEMLWGMPKHISDELVEAYPLEIFRKIGKWLFLIIMLINFSLFVWVWILCETLLRKNAIEVAEKIHGFAYQSNFGIGLLIGFFLSIFFTVIIVCLIFRVLPMPAKGALFIGSHEQPIAKKKTKKKKTKKNTSAIPNSPIPIPYLGSIWDKDLSMDSAAKLINSYSMKVGTRLSLCLIPYILIVVSIIHFELRRFTILNADGIHQTKIFSDVMTHKRWQDVQQVKLGCNHTSESGSLIYEVKWPDGSNIRFPTNIHMNGETWLTNLESVDKEISKSGAEFVRWTWLFQTSLHPRCLKKFYRQQGNGSKDRIDRLLRIGALD